MMSASLIERLFRSQILALSAYNVAPAGNCIKLDAMENPYSWPEELTIAWLEQLRSVAINRYPDPEAKQLAQTLKEVNQVPESVELLLGNGSDEIIQLLLMALPQGAKILTVSPGFVMYQQISLSLGLEFHSVALLPENFDLDLPALLTIIEQQQPMLIFIAYPNNPTGNLFAKPAIEALIAAAPGLVVIDEAYAPFAKASFMADIPANPQLLVMRTVSILGLAGLRLGFIAGAPEVIAQLNKIRLPYNINSLTQVTAHFALTHLPVFEAQTTEICHQRDVLYQQLVTLPGITVYPSAANFILLRTAPGLSNTIFASLKQQGILIKNLNSQGGLLTDCLRVTIGTPAENQLFFNALVYALSV